MLDITLLLPMQSAFKIHFPGEGDSDAEWEYGEKLFLYGSEPVTDQSMDAGSQLTQGCTMNRPTTRLCALPHIRRLLARYPLASAFPFL